MQLCESCGACRENEWRVCPFCRAELVVAESPASSDGDRFDALAAAAETTDHEVLPSPLAEPPEAEEPELALLTAQDLAHLTGERGPDVNGWSSAPPAAPASTPEEKVGVDAPVSKAVVLPLIAVAAAAVLFVAHSIVTASPNIRPDAVALIDAPTTTLETTITIEASTDPGVGAVGVDIAEQAARLCAGEQFSIARAEAPSLAVFNDLIVATRDGRDAWEAPPDHATLRSVVPPLVGCLTTADGGEIDRCPTDGYVISRRSVTWTYRVLQTLDGLELGSDSGTAAELRSCDELATEAGGEDIASWSPLPDDRLGQVAAAFTSAPHPQIACRADAADPPLNGSDPIDATTGVEPLAIDLDAPGLDASFDDATDIAVALPEGWSASPDRPVDVLLCLRTLTDSVSGPDRTATMPSTSLEEATPASDELAIESACDTVIRVIAEHRDGTALGSWDYAGSICPTDGQRATPPDDWWSTVVGPEIGYPLADASSDGE